MKVIENYNLKPHNTFGVDATCKRFVEIDCEEELTDFLRRERYAILPYMILGGGSNLLLTRDYEGTVFHSAIRGIASEDCADEVFVRAGSGEAWDDFVAFCIERGWHGAENLSVIPGDVGASAVQNIGAYGVEVKDIIYEVEAIDMTDGKHVTFKNEDCEYGYRHSKFKNEWKNKYLITHVTYKLSKSFMPVLDYGNIRMEMEKRGISTPTAAELRDIIIYIREEKLPDYHIEGNAGSFFMNPIVKRSVFDELRKHYPTIPHYYINDCEEKIPAGWLIEQCGWKGRTLGRAGVHSKQALVLVNRGGATGREIVSLSDAIRKDVKEKFNIDILPEVNIV